MERRRVIWRAARAFDAERRAWALNNFVGAVAVCLGVLATCWIVASFVVGSAVMLRWIGGR